MPNADFFRRLGLYSCERFLDAEACRRLRAAFQSGRRTAGTVGVKGAADFVVDPGVRSVRWVDVGDELAADVRARLLDVKPAIETFYDIPLTSCEPLQFLAYSVGDHYQPHQDSRPDATASSVSRGRRISAVVFVNAQSDAANADHYGGGALTFYGLFDHPDGRQMGIPLEPAEGLLMTFPAHMLHGVSPVTHGERYTIATWFF